MLLRLEAVLSWVGLITAIAYCLGWLKTLYYFDAFGIGLPAVNLSPTDYLFESWFVLENVFFFLLLAWITVTCRKGLLWAIAVAYFFIPIAAHYAFLRADDPFFGGLILYRHTILKFLPFAVLIVVAITDAARKRPLLKSAGQLQWSHGPGALVLFLLVIAAWSISTAKHFGSFDANRAMLWPDSYLPRVSLTLKLPTESNATSLTGSELYLVHANERQLFVWDRSGFSFGRARDQIRIVVVSRDAVTMIETHKPHEIQPGSLFF